ncbi:hypothetical protein F4827_006907 [Paraburkholderia bannensis]|uniref:Uncharacterized protein n=1 Tax=Paraburkholderia bannensis TaxID=765414 RepID=A0A7W9U4T5_9BURK|nr:hypothetical protein [Paraburkholderia sp. WP4_3_2]MBB6107027.1 hypothetical protein [Paraburkholderia bannensis]
MVQYKAPIRSQTVTEIFKLVVASTIKFQAAFFCW